MKVSHSPLTNPDRRLGFTLAAGVAPNASNEFVSGFHTVAPPAIALAHPSGAYGTRSQIWTPGSYNSAQPTATQSIYGLPSPWFGSNIVTSYFDGHANTMSIENLNDMRLWSNLAQGPNDTVPNDADLDN
jgi:hypothetical protein